MVGAGGCVWGGAGVCVRVWRGWGWGWGGGAGGVRRCVCGGDRERGREVIERVTDCTAAVPADAAAVHSGEQAEPEAH